MTKHTIDVVKTEQQIVFMTCDKCHKDETDLMELQEWLNISFTGGYNSIFGDSEEYDLDLCQQCTKELLGAYLRRIGNKQWDDFR
jgi:hypothetical protein